MDEYTISAAVTDADAALGVIDLSTAGPVELEVERACMRGDRRVARDAAFARDAGIRAATELAEFGFVPA